jgi:hypothetical protein
MAMTYKEYQKAIAKCDYKGIASLKAESPSTYGSYRDRYNRDMEREAELKEHGFIFSDLMESMKEGAKA